MMFHHTVGVGLLHKVGVGVLQCYVSPEVRGGCITVLCFITRQGRVCYSVMFHHRVGVGVLQCDVPPQGRGGCITVLCCTTR